MKKPRLICIGDLMLDVVVRADVALESGTDVPGTVRFRLGGSAGNTCRAFVALGGSASFVGAVGSDSVGKRLDAALTAAGVTTHLVRARGLTARLTAIVAADGERSFVTDRGVADSLRASDLKRSWFVRANALHLPAYSLLTEPLAGASVAAAEMARSKRPAVISVDLASRAPLLAAGADNALRAVRAVAPDVLFANMDEVRALVGRRGTRRLLDIAPLVVVKIGPGGCQLVWHDGSRASVLEMEVATKPITGADTTGAGDAFDAAFLYSMLSGGFARGGM